VQTGLFRIEVVEHLFGDYGSAQSHFRWLVIDLFSGPFGGNSCGTPCWQAMIDKCGQATKGVWWMPWHREATKDVVACDMLREAGKQALIRRFLNAETRFRLIGFIQR
jgi:hypothetical protein